MAHKVYWRFLVGEGFVSLVFSLLISMGGSTLAYGMCASLAERGQDAPFDMTYLQAAPRLAAVVHVVFFCLAMLALTRFRVYERAPARPRLHWALALTIYGLVGLLPGLIFWTLFSLADRPGI
jgi:hypothetical protein